MSYTIYFNRYFSDDEKNAVKQYIDDNFNFMELHDGWNCAIDVSNVIGRTANIDIFVK